MIIHFIGLDILFEYSLLQRISTIIVKGVLMNNELSAKVEAQAEIMKAFGHPIRLFIANEASKGEICVSEIPAIVEIDQSTISKHLSLLKHANIVSIEKRGTNIYYSLKMPCILDFLNCSQKYIRHDLKDKISSIKS